jgi:hypothetical protein
MKAEPKVCYDLLECMNVIHTIWCEMLTRGGCPLWLFYIMKRGSSSLEKNEPRRPET